MGHSVRNHVLPTMTKIAIFLLVDTDTDIKQPICTCKGVYDRVTRTIIRESYIA